MKKKPCRFRKKELAQWKIGLVGECEEVYHGKIEEILRGIEDEKFKCEALEKKLFLTQDAALAERLRQDLDDCRKRMAFKQEVLAQLESDKRLLGQLKELLGAHFTREQYAYIIEKIPDSLPAMLDSPDMGRVSEVYKIVFELYRDFCARVNAKLLIEDRMKDDWERIRAEHAAMQAALGDGP